MEIRHHLYPLLQLSFEGKASFLKTEASSRFWFQELLSSHEFKMERHISTIQNIGLQGKKNQPSKHTKKTNPSKKQNNNKKTQTHQADVLTFLVLPSTQHEHVQSTFCTSTRHGAHTTNSDVANSSRGLYPQQLEAADPPCEAQGQNYKSIQVPHVENYRNKVHWHVLLAKFLTP